MGNSNEATLLSELISALISLMSLENLTATQKAALIDFAVLGMYADGHLALRENTLLQKILKTLGFQEEFEWERETDASVVRVRKHSESKEKTTAYLRNASAAFSSEEDRKLIQKMLLEMMSSDEKVTPEEESFMKTAGELLAKI